MRRVLGKQSLTKNGLINIHDADFHKNSFVRHFLHHTGTFGILENSASPGDWQLTLTAGTIGSFNVNDEIVIRQDGVEEPDYFRITAKLGQVIDLNYPIRHNYVPGFPTTIELVHDDMALANLTDTASVANPVTFQLKPTNHLPIHITQINIQIEHSLAGSDDNFGSISELANGILICENKIKKRNHGVFRNNGNFRSYMGTTSVVYSDRAGPSTFATSIEWKLKQINDTIIDLKSMYNETLNINLQDNMETLVSMRAIGAGHFEEN
jgi:hypothetical protein